MKPAPFEHHAPLTVEQAVSVLTEVGHDGKVLAGGQSLIPILNMRLASPAHLVDINRVAGLDTVEVTADGRTGRRARAPRRASSAPTEAYAALPLLRQALVNVAHPAIRNRGTTVGSIAHADAAGEMPAILALTDGVVEVGGPGGPREIALVRLLPRRRSRRRSRPRSSRWRCVSAASRPAPARPSPRRPGVTATTRWPASRWR